jgi:hypothetical protein
MKNVMSHHEFALSHERAEATEHTLRPRINIRNFEKDPILRKYLVLCTFFTTALIGQQREIPFHVLLLFDHHQPRILGLTVVEGAETITIYTDDQRGTTGWIAGVMPHLPTTDTRTSRELEPSWFRRSDGAIVMIFRDQQSTFRTRRTKRMWRSRGYR